MDIQSVLHDRDLFNDIISQFAKHIDSIEQKYIIGIDFEGITLASAVGLRTNSPFTYLVSEKHRKFHVPQEMLIEIQNGVKVVLVTDVIVTGNTVNNAIQDLIKVGVVEENIVAILAILQRNSTGCSSSHVCNKFYFNIDSKYKDKLIVLNNNIDIEICSKDKCYFRQYDLIRHSNLPR